MDPNTVFDKDLFLYIPILTTHEGKICPYTIATGKFTKVVTTYHSMQNDLLETQSMINYLKDNPVIPGVVKASMFKAFIIQYAKCFTKPKGRVAKLEADSVFDSQPDLLEIHKEVMDMRHNYIAHAGTGKYDYGAMVLYLYPDPGKPSIARIIYSDLRFMDHSLKLPGYLKLCQRALEYINLKIEKLGPSYDKEVESIDLQELYKMSKTPNHKDLRHINHKDMQGARGPYNLRD